MKSHKTEHRVRYADTDKSGGVYYASYLNWFEIGRVELIRSLGITYSQIEGKGLSVPVVEINVKYKEPLEYDDLIVLKTSIAKVGTSSIRFEYRLNNDSETKKVAEAYTIHVFIDQEGVPKRIPESIRSLL